MLKLSPPGVPGQWRVQRPLQHLQWQHQVTVRGSAPGQHQEVGGEAEEHDGLHHGRPRKYVTECLWNKLSKKTSDLQDTRIVVRLLWYIWLNNSCPYLGVWTGQLFDRSPPHVRSFSLWQASGWLSRWKKEVGERHAQLYICGWGLAREGQMFNLNVKYFFG